MAKNDSLTLALIILTLLIVFMPLMVIGGIILGLLAMDGIKAFKKPELPFLI
ncbi:hypothetical protein ACFL1X_05330 [Candidatus Hydrogenedentota bacterium]